jgi:hypothetical protein
MMDFFLKFIKVHSMTPFGGEIKPLAHVLNLQHVKEHYKHEKSCFVGRIQLPSFFAMFLLLCC